MLDRRGGQAGLVAMLSARPLLMRFFQFAWLLTMPVRKDDKVLQRLGCSPTLWICPTLMRISGPDVQVQILNYMAWFETRLTI